MLSQQEPREMSERHYPGPVKQLTKHILALLLGLVVVRAHDERILQQTEANQVECVLHQIEPLDIIEGQAQRLPCNHKHQLHLTPGE